MVVFRFLGDSAGRLQSFHEKGVGFSRGAILGEVELIEIEAGDGGLTGGADAGLDEASVLKESREGEAVVHPFVNFAAGTEPAEGLGIGRLGVFGWSWRMATELCKCAMELFAHALGDELGGGQRILAPPREHFTAALLADQLVEQFESHPVIAMRGLGIAGQSAVELAQVEPGNRFEVGNDDAENAGRLQHAQTLAKEGEGVGMGQMLEEMGMINGVESVVAERQGATDIELPDVSC